MEAPWLEQMADALVRLPGVAAVALGGSRAEGRERPDSDWDVGVYYHEHTPPDVASLRALAADLDPRPERVVTEPWEWGPWVNGGAWLQVDGRVVDWLYRSIDQLDDWTRRSARGEREWNYAQTPTYGFHSHMLLAELAICRPLRDPEGELARLKALVATYPEGLRARLIQDFLWHAQFTLFHARKHARRGDVYNTTGCLTRAAHALVQALAAEARHWQIGDKRALLAIAPAEAREIEAALGRPADDLAGCVERLVALHARVCARVGEAYRPPFDLV